jgi:hypothetical protein
MNEFRQEVKTLVGAAGKVLEEVRQRPAPQPTVTRDFTDQLIYKEHVAAPPAPEMDAATQAAWDAWLMGHLERFMEQTIIPAVGEALGMTEKELLEEINTKLNALHTRVDKMTAPPTPSKDYPIVDGVPLIRKRRDDGLVDG